jgi:hypothetical protein
MSDRRFRWEIWLDPLNSNLDAVEWPGVETPLDEHGEVPQELLDLTETDTSIVQPSWDEDSGVHAIIPIKVVQTNQGFLTLTDNTLAANQFNFYTLHVNFDIGHAEALAIEACPGVETLDVVTRYRVRIGFPKTTFPRFEDDMWDLSAIKLGVEHALTALDKKEVVEDSHLKAMLSGPLMEKVEALKKEIEGSRHWAILILPNGEIESIASETKNEAFEERMKLFQDCEAGTGGHLMTSGV